MFMAPVEQMKPWQTNSVAGMARFLGRAWRLMAEPETGEPAASLTDNAPSGEGSRALHATIKRVTDDTEGMRLNTAIAALMEFVNAATKWKQRPREAMRDFVAILELYAPHFAEELWQRLGEPEPLAHAPWPEFDPEALKAEEKTIVVQVNGKVRARIAVAAEICEQREEALQIAEQLSQIQKYTAEKMVLKRIYVAGKPVNRIVAK